jgi:hypothetical protein
LVRVVEIVDDDQVEIGPRRHFAAAELAHGEHGAGAAGHDAVDGAEHRADPPMQRAHDRVGETREGLPGLLRGHRAGQDSRADQEDLLLAEQADAIEEILM